MFVTCAANHPCVFKGMTSTATMNSGAVDKAFQLRHMEALYRGFQIILTTLKPHPYPFSVVQTKEDAARMWYRILCLFIQKFHVVGIPVNWQVKYCQLTSYYLNMASRDIVLRMLMCHSSGSSPVLFQYGDSSKNFLRIITSTFYFIFFFHDNYGLTSDFHNFQYVLDFRCDVHDVNCHSRQSHVIFSIKLEKNTFVLLKVDNH